MPRVSIAFASMAAIALVAVGAAHAAGARAGEYGYGRQVAAPGEPIDLRGALPPVRAGAPAPAAQRSGAPIVSRTPVERVTATSLRANEPAPIVAPTPPPQRVERPEWLEAERAGAPYEAKGLWYVPTPDPGYAQTGRALPIATDFAGRTMATGETYDAQRVLAAHPTLPLPSLVQVTDLTTGRELIVRVADRGGFDQGAVVALSPAALSALGADASGVSRVHVRYLGPAPKRVDAAGASVAARPVPAVAAPAEAAPAAAAPQRVDGAYVVQVGAFGARDNAERARERAAQAGPAVVDVSGALHRVRVGPLLDRAEAERVRALVVALGFTSAMIAPAHAAAR